MACVRSCWIVTAGCGSLRGCEGSCLTRNGCFALAWEDVSLRACGVCVCQVIVDMPTGTVLVQTAVTDASEWLPELQAMLEAAAQL